MGEEERAEKPETLVGARFGSCVLDRVLSVGGMGTVYLAHQDRPRRAVAIKVLRPHLMSDPEAREQFLARFRREANATAALDHANIMPIYEFGEERDTAYLVMPYLAPGSLADLLARYGPLPISQVQAYVDQAAAALDYAHQHGIVHRDVKPSNFLLHPDGRLLLADFGIARPLPDPAAKSDATLPSSLAAEQPGLPGEGSALTQAGVSLGTPEFMAPEQIRGESVSAAADVYALGTVAFALLTGQPPFGGDTPDVFLSQLREPPPPLRSLRADAPAHMEEAIRWALSKDAPRRPASAGAFARALRGAAQSPRIALVSLEHRGQAADAGATRAVAGAASGSARDDLGDALTLADVESLGGSPPRKGPAWPLPRHDSGSHANPRRGGRLRRRLLGVGVLVLLLSLLIGGLSQAERFIPSFAATGPTPAAAVNPTLPISSVPTATASPTLAPSPTATSAPQASALALVPSSVTLDCTAPEGSRVMLQNTSGQTVAWTVAIQPSGSGLRVSPSHGRLAAGASTTVVIGSEARRVAAQGAILFRARDSATAAAQLPFTALDCH